jgi:serine/threonine protein phosphatase 1
MIGRFFTLRGRDEPAPPAAAPPGTRIYAVGDIHGRLDLLTALTERILADAAQHQASRKVVVYLGDYIDRGDQSRQVIEHLLHETLPGFERVHLKGNHEDIMLRFLADASVGPNWLTYGGMETLESYGIDPPAPRDGAAEMERARRALAAVLPSEHLAFLRALPLAHEEGGYFFVHAGIRPGVPLDQQTEMDMLWIRDEFLRSDAAFGRVVVHGHSIAPEPEIRRNRIGIDTGAFHSGHLTCLVAEGTERSFLQT